MSNFDCFICGLLTGAAAVIGLAFAIDEQRQGRLPIDDDGKCHDGNEQ